MQKKKYIIVGDNDFWYATTREITLAELTEELEEIKNAIKKGAYEDPKEPTQLFVYEANEVTRVDL